MERQKKGKQQIEESVLNQKQQGYLVIGLLILFVIILMVVVLTDSYTRP